MLKKAYLGPKIAVFWTNILINLDIWSQKSIFCFGIAYFVNRAYHKYTQGHNFTIGPIPQKKPFPSYDRSLSKAHPGFWLLRASPQLLVLILDHCQRNLVGLSLSGPKKMIHIGPGPGRHYGETAVLRYAEKHFFWPKIRFFSSKKTPEIR